MMMVNTDGIVLKSTKFEEADSIVILFTRKLGKISALGKGARRAKSILLSGTQVFSYSNFSLSRSGSIYKINQCEVKSNFYDLSQNIKTLSYASYITQLVEGSIFENQTNNRLFDLLLKTLYLYAKNNLEHEYITRVFELKFLDYIGYKPEVLRCVNCGKNKLNYKFSVIEGGILCKDCATIDINTLKIDPSTIKLMEYILKNDIIICSKAKVSNYIVMELKKILRQYIKNYVENLNLKSFVFLENLND